MKRKSIELSYSNILLDAELNIFRWYDFKEDAKILSVGMGRSLIKRFCDERGFALKEIEPKRLLKCGHSVFGEEAFDYVIVMEALEAETAECGAFLLREAFFSLKILVFCW